MPRRLLLSVGLLNALLLCGWGGVFAAVMCPHASARAAGAGPHACCRAHLKTKAAKPAAPHCHTQTEASGAAHGAAHNSHDGARLQDSESHGTAHAARDERAGGGLVPEGARAARAAQSSDACTHCVSRPERRNAPAAKARSGEGARREQSRPAPRVQARADFSFASFAPAIIPVQGSPPAPARLHVLLGVFRI